MFIVIDKRYREVARTDDVSEAMGLKTYFNSKKAYAPLQPFGVSFLPERMLPETPDNVLIFPKHKRRR